MRQKLNGESGLEKKVTESLTKMSEKFRWHPASTNFVFVESKFSIPITLK